MLLDFRRVLPLVDISDSDFNFQSVDGKRLLTEIIIFMLSLISERKTVCHVLKFAFFEDGKTTVAAKTKWNPSKPEVVSMSFNLHFSRYLMTFLYVVMHANFGFIYALEYYKIPFFSSKDGFRTTLL